MLCNCVLEENEMTEKIKKKTHHLVPDGSGLALLVGRQPHVRAGHHHTAEEVPVGNPKTGTCN
jgi:hypothetical protein